jgi:short-subunit dehydrogenase
LIYPFCEKNKIWIEILINNAGYAIRTQDEFVYPQKVSSMLQVMVVSLTELCFRFGHQMKQMKRGWILNVSSIVGCFPAASTLTYSASKRYIIEYSRYLHYELKNDGVAVTCLMPGPTKTNFSTNNKLPIPRNLLIFYLSAEQVASKGLLALAKNKTTIITGGISKVLIWISKLIPSSLLYMTQKKIWVEKRDCYL